MKGLMNLQQMKLNQITEQQAEHEGAYESVADEAEPDNRVAKLNLQQMKMQHSYDRDTPF